MITASGWIAIGVTAVIAVSGIVSMVWMYIDMGRDKKTLEELQYRKFQYDNHNAFDSFKD